MAQQKILRSRLQKVLSSSTSSLACSSQPFASSHKTYEVRVGPIYPYSWHLHQQPPQGYQQVFIGRNQSVPVGKQSKGPYKKQKLVTRSFSDLRSISLWQGSSFRASGPVQNEDDDFEDCDIGLQDAADLSLEKRSTATVRKGLLWQQRDKFFSQWKERYFILTPDYLQCFKRGTSRITEMGEFIYKIKLCELEDVELLDRRGYLVLCFTLQKEGKVYLRRTEGIREWYNSLKECVEDSKKRRDDRSNKSMWSTKQLTDSSSIEKWLQARKKIGLQYAYINSDSKDKPMEIASPTSSEMGPEPNQSKSTRSEITLDELSNLYRCEEEEERLKNQAAQLRVSASRDDLSFKPNNNVMARQAKKINRLSLMSDLELPDLSGGHDLLGLDLEKGMFITANKQRIHIDNDSNDSGNNSMNTNGSVASSNSSHSNHSNPREPRERLETHLESELPDDEEADQAQMVKDDAKNKVRRRSRDESARKYFGGNRRPSSHVMPNGLQVTHV